MREATFWIISVALALGCESSVDQPSNGQGGSGSGSTGGSGGSAASTGGTAGSPSGGAANAGGSLATGGASAGGSGGLSSGGSTGGLSSGGSTGGSLLGGSGGGLSSGGTAGGASGGSAGTAGTGGSGGSGECVPNIGCKLDPPPSTGDIYQDCVNRINQFLTQCACLPALQRATEGEACADEMAEYDAGKNSPHAGAIDNICQPNGAQNECPGYASNNQVISLCLQQMWDEGPPPTPSCTGQCYQDHGHFINMTDPSVHKVACGFHTTSSGNVWAVQNFFP